MTTSVIILSIQRVWKRLNMYLNSTVRLQQIWDRLESKRVMEVGYGAKFLWRSELLIKYARTIHSVSIVAKHPGLQLFISFQRHSLVNFFAWFCPINEDLWKSARIAITERQLLCLCCFYVFSCHKRKYINKMQHELSPRCNVQIKIMFQVSNFLWHLTSSAMTLTIAMSLIELNCVI